MSESAPARRSGGLVPMTVGQIVEVLRGRDANQYAVVVGWLNDRCVLLADGDKRKTDSPKKKNVAHVFFTGEIAEEVAQSLSDGVRVTNAKLRFCLHRFSERRANLIDPTVKEE